MEMIEVVIRIPKRDFDFIKDEFADGDMLDERDLKETTYYAIAEGTVLQKGHGRLIDMKDICPHCGTYGCEHSDICDTYNAPTIIEADKGEEE